MAFRHSIYLVSTQRDNLWLPLQSLWGLSALVILPVYLSFLPVFLIKDLPKIPNTHVDVISGAAAVISFIGELFMIKAILAYDGSRSRRGGSQITHEPKVRNCLQGLLDPRLTGSGPASDSFRTCVCQLICMHRTRHVCMQLAGTWSAQAGGSGTILHHLHAACVCDIRCDEADAYADSKASNRQHHSL
jgi:hypothetical protein